MSPPEATSWTFLDGAGQVETLTSGKRKATELLGNGKRARVEDGDFIELADSDDEVVAL